MDALVLGSSINSFVFFILGHLFTLVCFKERHALMLTKVLFVAVLVYDVYICSSVGIEVMLLSLLMLSLFICVYRLTMTHILFGTSLYVKLITVLDDPQPKTMEEILTLSSKSLLDNYLKQMLASKKIQVKEQLYSLIPQGKPLFLLGSIRQGLKDIVNTSSI
jgi:hypothetical protein